MKKLIYIFLICFASQVFASEAEKGLTYNSEQVKTAQTILASLRRFHFNKEQQIDESLSKKTFANYLDNIDPTKVILLKNDVQEFEKFQNSLHKLVMIGNLKPIFDFHQVYMKRFQDRMNFALNFLSDEANLNFTTDKTYNIERKDVDFPSDIEESDKIWTDKLTNEVLTLYINSKSKNEALETIKKRYTYQAKRLEQLQSEDVFSGFMNSLTMVFDPHTNYLSPDNSESFNIDMSLSLQGIGATLSTDNEHTVIVSLVPGGPADKSSLISVNDKIIAVAQGNEKAVDVVGWRLDEVVKLIRGPKGSTVKLEIIPASNPTGILTSKTISIIRDEVKLEDQAAKKDIIKINENGRDYKVGVITIPSFYMDFKAYAEGDENYRSTTRDVLNLFIALELEGGVDAYIIDLRSNGGGSLNEATELSNLFLGRKPVVQIRHSNNKVEVLGKEMEAEGSGLTINDKRPIAVLVDRTSASASEIFAAALQDYGQAIILGSQTFGKGTVQSVQELQNKGSLKLTVSKFYRVSGGSTQNKGVLADIEFPSLYNTEEIGESSYKSALPYDEIRPAYNLPGKDAEKINYLQGEHLKRIENNVEFSYNSKRLELVRKYASNNNVSLNEEKRKASLKEFEEAQLQLENSLRLAKNQEPLTSLSKDEEEVKSKQDKKASDDAYLVEAAYILKDAIKLEESLSK